MLRYKLSAKERFNIPFKKWYEFIADYPAMKWKIKGNYKTEPVGSWDGFDQTIEHKINDCIDESGFYSITISELKEIAHREDISLVWMKLEGKLINSTVTIWCFDGAFWLFKTDNQVILDSFLSHFKGERFLIEQDPEIW